MNVSDIVLRRTGELSASTRAEILMSIGAALLLVAMTVWRLQVVHERLLEAAIAVAILWAAVSVYFFRHQIWPPNLPQDAVAASGLDYYRRELERRRDHLRNEWLWHGPLVLAAVVFAAVWTGRANVSFRPLLTILPLVALLAAWTAFGIRRRWMQARALQREIDELATLAQPK